MENDLASMADPWASTGGHSPLLVFFNALHPLSQEAADYIDQHTYPLHAKKGSFLVQPSASTNDLYWVIKGVVRGYIKEGRKEITTWINEENEVVGSIRNFGIEMDSDEYVQVIEESDLVVIPFVTITYLYANFPEANTVGRILLEENYRAAEERAYISRIPSAEKRYRRFTNTHAALLNRIPLKYIASYLGMTIETMSRIRSRKYNTVNAQVSR